MGAEKILAIVLNYLELFQSEICVANYEVKLHQLACLEVNDAFVR